MRIAIPPSALLLFSLALAYGQTGAKSPTFDVASVKVAELPKPDGRGMIRIAGPSGGPGTSDPGRVHYPYMTLRNLLTTAYDVKNFQIQGPASLDTERFEISATMPAGTTKEQFHLMLQNLLAERFKLTLHRETKELPMYSLVVTKNGPKIKESAATPPPDSDQPAPPLPERPTMGADGFPVIPLGGRAGIFNIMMNGRARMIAQQQTMKDLADRLTGQVNRPVKDETGLTAKYDFTITYEPDMGGRGPMPGMPGPAGGAMVAVAPPGGGGGAGGGGAGGGGGAVPASDDPLPNLFAALQSQLGLKLEAKKGPVEMIVIDHVEKTPTEN